LRFSAAKERHAGEICLRPIEARHEAALDRVFAGDEDNRNGRGGSPRGVHRDDIADDSGDLPAHKFGREAGQPVELVVGMALLDRDGAAFDKSFIAQPLAQGRDEMRERCGRSATQKPDHRHRRLLRPRRDWPSGCHAAEQCDELAAFQLIELHSVPTSQGGIAGYRIGEDQ